MVDSAINAVSDRIIDSVVPESNQASREIAKAGARAAFNPFSNQGFDDLEIQVQKYFGEGQSGSNPASPAVSEGSLVLFYGDLPTEQSEKLDLLIFGDG